MKPRQEGETALRQRIPAVLLLCAAVFPLRATAQSLPPALARAERTYDRLLSLRTQFTQIIANPMMGGPDTTTGTLWLAPPARFAMRFSNGDRLVADGTYLWAWTPSTMDDQVIRQPIPAEGAVTPNLFGQFVEDPASRYDISMEPGDRVDSIAVDVVRLVPHDVDAMGFRRADLAIDANGWIRRLVLVESSGQRRTLVFRNITPGAAVPPDEVRFVVPDGVRIVGG